MSDKVKVISQYNGRCGIDNSDLRISRRWPARGSYVTIDKEVLEELMYDPAFKNMVDEGYLYIEDLKLKKELGIEPEEATTSTIINLTFILSDIKFFIKTLACCPGNTFSFGSARPAKLGVNSTNIP